VSDVLAVSQVGEGTLLSPRLLGALVVDAVIGFVGQRRDWFAQLVHALVAYLIGEDSTMAATNIAWIGSLPTHELASRELVPADHAVVVLSAVAWHLTRSRC
jgi:hypothetical protein